MKTKHKFIICYIGIIIITSIIFIYFNEKSQVQEGLLGIPGTESVKTPKAPSTDSIGKSILDGLKPILDDVTTPFQPLISIVNEVGEDLKQIPARLELIGHSLVTFGKAFESTFVNPGKSVGILGKDVGNVIGSTWNAVFQNFLHDFFGIYIGSLVICFYEKLKSLPSCFGIYVVKTIGYITYYMFIGMPVYMLDLFTGGMLNLQATIDKLYALIVDVVMFFFSERLNQIYKKCFYCPVPPMPIFNPDKINDAVNTITYDVNKTIPDLMNDIKANYYDYGSEVKGIFSKDMKTSS